MAKRLHRALLNNMLLIILATLVLVGAVWLTLSWSDYRERLERDQARNREWRRTLLRTMADQVVDYELRTREETERRVHETLRERVMSGNALLEVIVERQENQGKPQSVLEIFTETMRPVRFDGGRGYYFGLRADGSSMLFATPTSFEGHGIFESGPPQAEETIQDLVKTARNGGSGFLRYRWSKPGEEGYQHEKISYVMLCEKADCVIGSGEYIDEIEKQVKQQTVEWVNQLHFERGGSVLLIDRHGAVLADSSRQKADRSSDGWRALEKQIRDNPFAIGFVRLANSEETRQEPHPDQVLFYRNVPGRDYFVATVMDGEDLALRMQTTYANVRDKLMAEVTLIFSVLAMVGLLALLLVRKTSNSLEFAFFSFNRFFEKATQNDEPIDEKIMPFEEFRSLARSANHMLAERSEAYRALLESRSELQETQALLSAAVEQSPAGIIIADGKTHKGRMANYMAMEMFGEDIVGTRKLLLPERKRDLHWQSLHPDGTPYERGEMPLSRAVLDGEIVRNEETVIRYKDGRTRHLLVNASPIRDTAGIITAGIVLFLDITDLKRMVYERSRLAAASEQSNECVFLTNADMRLEYVNPAFEKILEEKRADCIGRSLWFLAERTTDGSGLKGLEDATKRGSEWAGTFQIKKLDGSRVDVEASMAPIRDDNEDVTGYAGILRDITDELHIQSQLRHSQKMEAIGTLAGGIAHDFNNMLQAICGFSNLALEELSPDQRVYSHVKQIAVAGNRASELVAQILTFSRQNDEMQKPFVASSVVKEVVKLLEGSFPSTIAVRSSIESRMSIVSSPSQIHQVVMNLATNAFHAMRRGSGTLEVVLEDVELDGESAEKLVEIDSGRYVVLRISDTGCGMDARTLERIFEPFFTTRQSGEGTGLGLSTVHGIVRRSGGTITVESEVGKGTCFRVYFPVVEDAVGEEDTPGAEMDLPGGSECVMVVDDEETIARLAATILSRRGYRTEVFTQSLEALAAFKSDPEKYHLVLTDMTMPGLTGADLAEAMLQCVPDIPIMLCTGFSESINEASAKAIGIKRFIRKPFSEEEISLLVREVLDSRT